MPSIQTALPDIGDKEANAESKTVSRPEPIYERAEHAPRCTGQT